MFSSTSPFPVLTRVVFLLIADAEDGLHAPVGFTHSVTAAHMPVVKRKRCMRDSDQMHTQNTCTSCS